MAAPAAAATAWAGTSLWQKRRWLLWLLALVIAGPLALALLVVVLIASGDGGSQIGQFRPSALALRDIPPAYLRAYEAAGTRYELGWEYLAAIGKIETDHGRSTAAGVRTAVNTAGCCAGPMQFSVVGSPSTWDRYGVDGDGDGRRDVYDPADAIPAAAHYLQASGAPADWDRAIFAYNHASWYVADVKRHAQLYRGAPEAAAPGNLAGAGNPDPAALGSNPNITWAHPIPQVADLRARRVSPRLISLLALLARRHEITITALASDHYPGTNHEAGRAADIAIVDADNCYPPDRSGGCWALAQQLDRLQGCLHPTELISYFDPGPSPDSYARADHDDHIHVGFDGPLGARTYDPDIAPCSPAALTAGR
ncbi:MAG: lytic transglycosylase domain-containing protein [Solirubrobacteraceae bacterium]